MTKEKIINMFGTAGATLAILMFVSLIEIAKDNLAGESHIYIMPAVTTLNCIIWSIYGYMKKEKFVFWANVPGVLLGIITVLTAFIT